jgi:hypothetical protein
VLPQLTSRLGPYPNLLLKWRTQALKALPNLFSVAAKDKRVLEPEYQRQLGELYGERGRLTTQLASSKLWSRTLRQTKGSMDGRNNTLAPRWHASAGLYIGGCGAPSSTLPYP